MKINMNSVFNNTKAVLRQMLKQRNESVEMYEKAKRQDLVDKEKNEIEIMQNYENQNL